MSRDQIRARLAAFICKEALKDPSYPLSDEEPLLSGGLISSFYLVQIAMFAEKELGVHIPDADLTVEKMDTLAQMVDRIMQEMS
ncbi:MAG TPA: acyl carrier protein [Ardenticatenaceae bacterium]|nr:acyl carrier protein [Ardenticatenaceae bacterium]